MARAVSFPGADPEPQQSLSETYGDLPVKTLGDQTLSCWQLDEREREEVARTGKVWVFTTTMTRAMFDRNPDYNELQTPLLVSGIQPGQAGN
jgi:hypothetical protein